VDRGEDESRVVEVLNFDECPTQRPIVVSGVYCLVLFPDHLGGRERVVALADGK
jgi:hypothetical protein